MTLKQYKIKILKNTKSKKLNFMPDGRQHSVYRITHKLKLEHYYGSKSNDKVLGVNYISSSTDLDFIQEQESFPERFNYKIIETYDNTADKMIHEAYLHQKFDVKNHLSFYNKANQTPFGFDTTGNTVKQETRDKLRISSSRRKHSTETKMKISKANSGKILGKMGKEQGEKIGQANKRRVISNKTREILSKLNSGKNSPQAKKIKIFDESGIERGITHGNFESFCSDNNFPTSALQKSYRRQGERIYSSTKSLKSWAINNGLEEFIGWSAKVQN